MNVYPGGLHELLLPLLVCAKLGWWWEGLARQTLMLLVSRRCLDRWPPLLSHDFLRMEYQHRQLFHRPVHRYI